MNTTTHNTTNFLRAGRDSAPIGLGYFVVSAIFGIGCVNYGLPVWFAPLISLLVYAGAAQFAFLALFVSGASFFTITLAVFFINLRHSFMSIYMANVFNERGFDKGLRWLYGFQITDEAFAVQSLVKDKSLSKYYYIFFNNLCHFWWVMGATFGSVVISKYALELPRLDYTLTAMMIFVLVLLANTSLKIKVAVVTTIAMLVLSQVYQSHFNIFIATFIGCGFGVWMKLKN